MTREFSTLKVLEDSSYTWKHLNLSDADTAKVEGALEKYAGTHTKFDLLNANCDEVLRQALEGAGLTDLAKQITGIPALDAHNHMDTPRHDSSASQVRSQH